MCVTFCLSDFKPSIRFKMPNLHISWGAMKVEEMECQMYRLYTFVLSPNFKEKPSSNNHPNEQI